MESELKALYVMTLVNAMLTLNAFSMWQIQQSLCHQAKASLHHYQHHACSGKDLKPVGSIIQKQMINRCSTA